MSDFLHRLSVTLQVLAEKVTNILTKYFLIFLKVATLLLCVYFCVMIIIMAKDMDFFNAFLCTASMLICIYANKEI